MALTIVGPYSLVVAGILGLEGLDGLLWEGAGIGLQGRDGDGRKAFVVCWYERLGSGSTIVIGAWIY
jgi:hypothetical protein